MSKAIGALLSPGVITAEKMLRELNRLEHRKKHLIETNCNTENIDIAILVTIRNYRRSLYKAFTQPSGCRIYLEEQQKISTIREKMDKMEKQLSPKFRARMLDQLIRD